MNLFFQKDKYRIDASPSRQSALMAPVVEDASPTRAGIASPRPFGAGARRADAMMGQR
jgi:hypothetical protein